VVVSEVGSMLTKMPLPASSEVHFCDFSFFRSWGPGVSPGGGLGGSAPEAKLRAAGEASAILAFSCAKMTLNVHNFANEGPTSEVNPWEVNMMRGGVPMYQCATDDHTKGILQRLDQSNVAAIDLSAYDVPLQCSGSRWRIKIQRSDLPESDWNERSDMKPVIGQAHSKCKPQDQLTVIHN
jgi:hypothetical protein